MIIVNNAFAPDVPTRLYLTTTAAGYDPATERGAWDTTTGYSNFEISTTKAGVASTDTVSETSATMDLDKLGTKFVTDGLPLGLNITGTLNWVIGLNENSTDANVLVHVHVFVTAGNTDTLRGTLLTDFIGATELTTTATGRSEGAQTLSSVSASAGDLIVIEWGYRFGNNGTTNCNGVLNYGNTGGTDLTNGSTNVTTEPGWFEFSIALGL